MDASKHVRIRGQAIKKPNFFFLIYCFTYNLIILVTFKVLPSTLDTPLPTFFPFLERVLNVLYGTAQRSPIEFSSISSTVRNRRPFSEDFHFGTRKSPQRPNLESRAAGAQQSSHASSKKFMDKERRVSRHGTNFAATRRIFGFSVKIRWHETFTHSCFFGNLHFLNVIVVH